MGNAIAMQSLSVIRVERSLSAAQVWMDGEHDEMVEQGASYAELQASYSKVATARIYDCYYRAYRTKDGAFALGTLAVPPRIRLLRFLGLSDQRVEVPGYDESTPEAAAMAERLVERMETEFAKRTTSEWITELRKRDIPCEPVRFVEQIVDDEQAIANDYVVEMKHPAGGRYRSAGPVVDFKSGNPPLRPSPTLGQHSREILEELGLDEPRIDRLLSARSVS